MNVRITNVTDAPGLSPQEVRVYNKRLPPGRFMDIPAKFVDDKVRKLEEAGYIAIGSLPPWYADHKARRIKPDQVHTALESRKKYFADREKNKEPKASPKAEPARSQKDKGPSTSTPSPEEMLDLSEPVIVEDTVSTTKKSKRTRSKKKE